MGLSRRVLFTSALMAAVAGHIGRPLAAGDSRSGRSARRVAPPQVQLVQGDDQIRPPGEAFRLLTVRVTDENGPLVSARIRFVVTGSTGSSFAGNHSENTVATDDDGTATASQLIAGPIEGRFHVEVHLPDGTVGTSFTETVGRGDGDDAPELVIVSGDGQHHPVGESLAPLIVQALDGSTPVPGEQVTFTLTDADDTGTGLTVGNTMTVITDASGHAQAELLPGDEPGTFRVDVECSGYGAVVFTGTIDPTGGGDPGVILTAKSGANQTTTPNSAFPEALVAHCTDDELGPVQGAIVHFYVGNERATFPGNQASATVMTDADGNATAPTLTAGPVTGDTTVVAATGAAATHLGPSPRNASVLFTGLTIIAGRTS